VGVAFCPNTSVAHGKSKACRISGAIRVSVFFSASDNDSGGVADGTRGNSNSNCFRFAGGSNTSFAFYFVENISLHHTGR
jgi:hypothetical protein